MRWEESWGIGVNSGQRPRLDPRGYRYRYVISTLARIVAEFANVERLQSRYGVVLNKRDDNGNPHPSIAAAAKREPKKFHLLRKLSPTSPKIWHKSLPAGTPTKSRFLTVDPMEITELDIRCSA